MSKNT